VYCIIKHGDKTFILSLGFDKLCTLYHGLGKSFMLDWLIIGGGIQGTTLANYLIHRYGAHAEHVRILDPHPHLLAQWNHAHAQYWDATPAFSVGASSGY
jgi:hypothetical protein